MEGGRAELFLRKYRILEGLLEKRYSSGARSGSVVMEYTRDPDSEAVRHELNICREIRNLLSHSADEAGLPLVEPSDAVLEMLDRVLAKAAAPRLALDCATRRENLLFARENDRALDIMHRMRKCGYSHVPVLRGEVLTGVFSASSIFNHLERRGLTCLSEDTRIGTLKDDLAVDSHGAERYRFYPAGATLDEVRAAFARRPDRPNWRLSAVFLTDDGTQDGSVMGMLTPWDALNKPMGMGENDND